MCFSKLGFKNKCCNRKKENQAERHAWGKKYSLECISLRNRGYISF